MGKAHHTAFTWPSWDSRKAAGISTTSWRMTDTHSARTPRPSAWNSEEQTTENPAMRKCSEMMRSAGTPMVSISSLALKMPSSLSGKSWATAKPASMMETAATTANLTVARMRSGLRAPRL